MKEFSFNKIYVIESLNPVDDTLSGTELYNDVLRYITYKDSDLSSELISVDTKAKLLEALKNIEEECIIMGFSPIIHFEIHGSIDQSGLVTFSNELITWEELHPILIAINVASRHNLFITLAVCHGAYLFSIHHISKRAPFWGFVGSYNSIKEPDLILRYNAFYITLLRNFNLGEAVIALHNANPSTPSSYKFINSEDCFLRLYTLYVAKEFNTQAIKNRWKKALNESEITLLNRWTNRKFKRDFTAKLLTEKEYQFKKHRRNFFMIDLYPENKEYLKDYSPFTK